MAISLHEALISEIKRVEELADIYSSTPLGAPIAYSIGHDVLMAREAINRENISLMCVVYQTLKKYN